MNRRELLLAMIKGAAFGALGAWGYKIGSGAEIEQLSRWVTMDGGKTFRVSNKDGGKLFSAASHGFDRMDLTDRKGNLIPLRNGEVYEAPYNSMYCTMTRTG